MNEVWHWGRCLTLSGSIMVAAASLGGRTDSATVGFLLGLVLLVAGTGLCFGCLRESRRAD